MPPPPPGKFLNKRCDFVHSVMILSSNFVSFWRRFFVFYPSIWQENIEMERRKLCDGTDVLPYIFVLDRVFLCFFLLGDIFGGILSFDLARKH